MAKRQTVQELHSYEVLIREHSAEAERIIKLLEKEARLKHCDPVPPRFVSKICRETSIRCLWHKSKKNYFEINIHITGSNAVWIFPCNVEDKVVSMRKVFQNWREAQKIL